MPSAVFRAILKLRNMREEYAVALRQQHEGNAPPLSMFRSQVPQLFLLPLSFASCVGMACGKAKLVVALSEASCVGVSWAVFFLTTTPW